MFRNLCYTVFSTLRKNNPNNKMSGRPHLSTQEQETPREQFLKAAESISPKYQDRLSAKTLEKIKGDNLFFDIHAHCFTFQNVPKNFTRLQLIKVPHGFFKSWIYKFLGRFIKEPDSGIFAFFSVGAYYNSTLITKKLLNNYSKFFKEKKEEKHFVIGMLSMNMEYAISQEIPENHERQMQDLIKTCQYFDREKKLKYTASILPFVGLDPNNKETYQLFLNAFANNHYLHPVFGIKIYPTLGFLPSHPTLMDVFEIAEQKQIPITTHCGGAATKTDSHKVDIKAIQINKEGALELKEETFEGSAKDDYVAFFNGPDRWKPVLKKYPKLQLNIAHFGSSDQWENYFENKKNPQNHVFQTLKLVETNENVFADISYTFFDRIALTEIRDLMIANPIFQKRFLFGSDFYMVLSENDIHDIMTQFYQVFENHENLVRALTIENPKQFLFPSGI